MGLKDEVLAMVESAVKQAIEANSDKVVESAIVALEGALKSQLATDLLESVKAKVEEAIKAQLLALADKISPAV
jgi:hypothetical protein